MLLTTPALHTVRLRSATARLLGLLLAAPIVACAPEGDSTSSSLSHGEMTDASAESDDVNTDDDAPGTSDATTDHGDATSDDGATATTATTVTTTTSDATTGDATTGDATSATSGADDDGLACNGKIYACNDGDDNDGDGLIDAADPECITPCDDDEETFKTGLPGDNVDCKQDCFFDGNSGQGDDGCNWDLRCDPENPGAGLQCEYKDGPQCKDGAHDVDDQCVAACAGNTPPGCDCFGCCTVETEDGPIDIFLNSPGCALDNLDACNACTPSEDCGNPCDPDDCELCFGEAELPEGCDENNCGDAPSCTVDGEGQSDCPEGMYCLVGCCYEYGIPE